MINFCVRLLGPSCIEFEISNVIHFLDDKCGCLLQLSLVIIVRFVCRYNELDSDVWAARLYVSVVVSFTSATEHQFISSSYTRGYCVVASIKSVDSVV